MRRAIREHVFPKLVMQHLVTVVHGAAPGADAMAELLCREVGIPTEPHPARWSELDRRAGAIRNRQMLEPRPDLCLAFYVEGAENTGTHDMASLCRCRGIPVVEFVQRR